MTASYPTSIKSFTTKVDNVTQVQAVDVNGLQDEVVAIETALGTTGSPNVMSYVAPSTSGNVLTSNGSAWTSTAPTAAVTDGWNADLNTWIYSSVDSPTGIISVNADMTGKVQKGMRIKYNQAEALTAYFPFDANSTSTVGSFTSTDVNTPTYTAGKFGNALTLVAASSQAVNITDTALMQLAGEFTIGAWIKTSTASTDKCIFSSYAGATSKYAGVDVSITTTNKISFGIYANTGTTVNVHWSQIVGATTVTDNAWHYVVATLRNNYMQIYVDGVLDGQGYTPFTPTYQATNYVRIGALCSTGTNGNFMSGQIDDLFTIKGYALDEETIRAKYLAGTAQGTSAIAVTKKAIVTNVGAWSGSATLITAYHGTDHMLTSGAITSPYYSSVKVPFGFNVNPDKWSVLYTRTTNFTKTTPGAITWYYTELGSDNISAPIGSWYTTVKNEFYGTVSSTAAIVLWVGISTANSGTPNLIKSRFIGTALTSLYAGTQINLNTVLNYSVKTAMYILYMAESAIASIVSDGTSNPTIFKLTSAYL